MLRLQLPVRHHQSQAVPQPVTLVLELLLAVGVVALGLDGALDRTLGVSDTVEAVVEAIGKYLLVCLEYQVCLENSLVFLKVSQECLLVAILLRNPRARTLELRPAQQRDRHRR